MAPSDLAQCVCGHCWHSTDSGWTPSALLMPAHLLCVLCRLFCLYPPAPLAVHRSQYRVCVLHAGLGANMPGWGAVRFGAPKVLPASSATVPVLGPLLVWGHDITVNLTVREAASAGLQPCAHQRQALSLAPWARSPAPAELPPPPLSPLHPPALAWRRRAECAVSPLHFAPTGTDRACRGRLASAHLRLSE